MSLGVELIIIDNPDCRQLMDTFIQKNPELWNEDIGELNVT
jgi:cytosine deaminase